MSHDKELLARVESGIEVEAFIRGPIGKFLLAGLKAEADAALEKLKTVNPREVEEIIRLQLVIERGANIEGWLAGIIEEGLHAERQLQGEEG